MRSKFSRRSSRPHFREYRSAEVSPGVAEGEPFVVKSQQVENRGVEVVNMHFVFHSLVPEFVGGAITASPLLRLHRPSRRRIPGCCDRGRRSPVDVEFFRILLTR